MLLLWGGPPAGGGGGGGGGGGWGFWWGGGGGAGPVWCGVVRCGVWAEQCYRSGQAAVAGKRFNWYEVG